MNIAKNIFCSGTAISIGAGIPLAIYFYTIKLDKTNYKTFRQQIKLITLIGGILGFTTWNARHILLSPKIKRLTFRQRNKLTI